MNETLTPVAGDFLRHKVLDFGPKEILEVVQRRPGSKAFPNAWRCRVSDDNWITIGMGWSPWKLEKTRRPATGRNH